MRSLVSMLNDWGEGGGLSRTAALAVKFAIEVSVATALALGCAWVASLPVRWADVALPVENSTFWALAGYLLYVFAPEAWCYTTGDKAF